MYMIFISLSEYSQVEIPKRVHVKMLNNEETVPFPQYLVVNSCNLDGIKYMCAPLIIYE